MFTSGNPYVFFEVIEALKTSSTLSARRSPVKPAARAGVLPFNGFVAQILVKSCGCSDEVCFFCNETESRVPHPQLEQV
jgi:hypothetical protein